VRSADCFELFGLTPGFNLDAALLTRRYLAICRNVHPDAYASAERGVQEAALGIAAAVNRAYDILREPARRAEYLLAIAGGPSAQEDRAVPDGLLPEVMMLREEMEEALAGSDRQTLADLRSRAAARKQAIDGRIGDLAGRLGDGPAARGELRRQLNALKYWDNLLADLSAAALRSPEQGP
jgi:molecular chaperone HscB